MLPYIGAMRRKFAAESLPLSFIHFVNTAVTSTIVVARSNLRRSQRIANSTMTDTVTVGVTVDSCDDGVRPGIVLASFPTVELI